MTKTELINRVSIALYENRCIYFIGSGISYPSTNILWGDLLKPFIAELGININSEFEDLPRIAQYIVNYYNGNRGPLLGSVTDRINKEFAINEYLHSISITKIRTIWTTNYDLLLERAFNNFHIDTKINDSNISRNTNNSSIEIIKMHGCIKGSHAQEIVLTQEDYEDYSVNRPATTQRLCTDLLQNSFLFLGYSYNDPNIQNIVVQARRLANRSTKEHYMIQKRVQNKKNPMTEQKQLLWINDLKRYGISTLLIDDFSELSDILDQISQKSRGKTIFITGSHSSSDNHVRELGMMLAEMNDIVLISGQSAGVGSLAVSSFTETCILNRMDIMKRLEIFPNPYLVNPHFSNDPKLIPELKRCRSPLMAATQIVIAFPGGMGTIAEIEVAVSQNCKIIPVAMDVKDKSDSYNYITGSKIIMDRLEKLDKTYCNKYRSCTITTTDIIDCITKAIR